MENNNKEMVTIGSFITYASSGPITTTIYMEEKAFCKNEIKKDLYKSKNMASFSHYISGNLYYNIVVFGELYQFPISTYTYPSLSEDLGTTTFEAEMKGSELNRWIAKAIDKGEFIKIA